MADSKASLAPTGAWTYYFSPFSCFSAFCDYFFSVLKIMIKLRSIIVSVALSSILSLSQYCSFENYMPSIQIADISFLDINDFLQMIF